MRRGNPLADRAHPFLGLVVDLFLQRPHRSRDLGMFGNDVVGVTGMKLRHRHHETVDRVGRARHDRLQRKHDLAGDDDRIDRAVRHRRVSALAVDLDGKFRGRRHDRAGPDGELADRQPRHVVHAEHLGDVEPLHHAVVDHHLAAAAAFLRRLEDQRHAAREVPRLREIFRSAQKHRRVAVMAAGMHLVWHGRGVRLSGDLVERQRVHVGAQADRPAGPQIAIDDPHDAGSSEPRHHLVAAEFLQLVGDERRRLVHVEQQFRLHVDLPAPFGDFVLQFGCPVQYRHAQASFLVRVATALWNRSAGFAILASHTLNSTGTRLVDTTIPPRCILPSVSGTLESGGWIGQEAI